MPTQFLTTAEVAARWRCARSTVTALARAGKLGGMRLGTDWRFSVAAVEAFEAPQSQPAESRPAEPAVQAAPAATGISLPDGYVPVFVDLWPSHAPRVTKRAASAGG